MPIFDKKQTSDIRKDSKAFADSIFPTIEPQVKELVCEFKLQGYGAQTFSLVFSYLLDCYIWSEGKLITPSDMESHGTWSGAYWAMYEKREKARVGTNGYGPLYLKWTDELDYCPSDKLMLDYANHIMNNGVNVKDENLKARLQQCNFVDSNGDPSIPVINKGNHDRIDQLCDAITTTLSDAIKLHVRSFGPKFSICHSEV